MSCQQLNWTNIHSLNTENNEFLKETLRISIIAYGAVHKPPFTISDALSDKNYRKRRVSNHGVVNLANSACVNIKKKIQDLEGKIFGMSVRTKARSKAYDNSDTHYEIEMSFDKKAKG